jgi:hypothetical protein
MDIREENKVEMKKIWDDERERQSAKILIMEAIGRATAISVAEASAVCDELDALLLTEQEEEVKQKDHAI